VKLAIVVQRYGSAINGGAELHARYVAEHLSKHVDVEVLTSCAADYVTWRNELSPGVERINGVPVRRFRVSAERIPHAFGRHSARVFRHVHSLADEFAWLRAEGPRVGALVSYLTRHAETYDFCLFFSYRYYHAYHGARTTASRAILVPTAEQDEAIGLAMFQPIFRGVRALMYNSPEERRMIQAVSGNQDRPSVVVGIGSDVPPDPQAGRFRQKYAVPGRFAVYIGRIDQNKGCEELFDLFQGYLQDPSSGLSLVLIGHSLLPIPDHPRIRYLGFLDDVDKFDALAAAEVLIMPSRFESLSMVMLEAWALGRPVIANGTCDVLKGQCLRSNAGLYYESRLEFLETLRAVEQHRWLNVALGKNGRDFFRAHYDWPIIERKYLDMFARLAAHPAQAEMAPLPGWLERRRPTLPAAADVYAQLPTGPASGDDSDEASRPSEERLPSTAAPAEQDVAGRGRQEPRPPRRGARPFRHRRDTSRRQSRGGRQT
jgi:glycosyltransferase involved in cell wall biosynthesis